MDRKNWRIVEEGTVVVDAALGSSLSSARTIGAVRVVLTAVAALRKDYLARIRSSSSIRGSGQRAGHDRRRRRSGGCRMRSLTIAEETLCQRVSSAFDRADR